MSNFRDSFESWLDEVDSVERQVWDDWLKVDQFAHRADATPHKVGEIVVVETVCSKYELLFRRSTELQPFRHMSLKHYLGGASLEEFQYYPKAIGSSRCEIDRVPKLFGKDAVQAMAHRLTEITDQLGLDVRAKVI